MNLYPKQHKTDMDKIARLRQEIKRRIKLCNAAPICSVRAEVNKQLLSLLDTLSEEPDKSLEEVAEENADLEKASYDAVCRIFGCDPMYFGNKAEITARECDYLFRAGVEWRDSQLPKLSDSLDEAADIYEAYYDVGEEHGYLYCLKGDIKNAFIAGARWQTEHLKK